MIVITPAQCRAARGLLKWSQPDLASRCNLNAQTIGKFENEQTEALARRTNDRIVSTFEMAGVVFTAENGLRLGESIVTVLEGDDANTRLLDDIFHTLQGSGGEILLSGLREADQDKQPEAYKHLLWHLDRLRKAGISERILVVEGDTNFVAPVSWYRWLPERYFSDTPYQLYADKVALVQWGPPQTVVLVKNPLFARTLRGNFDFIWDHAIVPPGADGER